MAMYLKSGLGFWRRFRHAPSVPGPGFAWGLEIEEDLPQT